MEEGKVRPLAYVPNPFDAILTHSETFHSAACPDAQRDVIFLVHTTRDKAYNAEVVQSFLSNIISTVRPGPETTRVTDIIKILQCFLLV